MKRRYNSSNYGGRTRSSTM